MFMRTPDPQLSVIIPTYNRSGLLDQTLYNLTRQTIAGDRFEVIIADDGSSDDTKDVVDSYAGRLRIQYHYQEDLGYRVSTARNAGARMAGGSILVFLDTGALVGPQFVAGHIDAHGRGRRAVAGYAYAYNPKGTPEGLAEALAVAAPEDVIARFNNGDDLRDVRHDALSSCGFDLNAFAIPWMLFWTMNCSIRADDFFAVGGFEDDFVGWGLEDMEFAFRVHRSGVPFEFNRDAWVVHAPHERDWGAELGQLAVNVGRFLALHPEPIVEIGWALITRYQQVWPWEQEYRKLTSVVAPADVSAELAAAWTGSGEHVAVFGAGGTLPPGVAPEFVTDFDAELLQRTLSAAGPGTVGQHAIGLRTQLADQAVDTVIVTSRLAPLWDRWGGDILAEAQRVGRTVRTFEVTA